ncbi:MAG TPA: DUF2474 domain-containing protein [Bradyrhizobium sp.]|nr:DUF2474 domain-containing protein [Bradyrhizobium sp.]
MPPERHPRPLIERLLWFVLLWLGGVGTVAILAYGLKLWIAPR